MRRRRMPCDSLLAIRRVPSKITSSATERRFADPKALYSGDNVLFLGGKIGAQELLQSHDLLIRKRSKSHDVLRPTGPAFDLQVPFGPTIADWAYGEKIATMTIELHGVKSFGLNLVYASIRT
jgi:hypothetical protein